MTARGTAYVLDWRAVDVHTVRIYAGSDAQRIDTAQLVATGGGSGTVTVSDLPQRVRWYFKISPDRGDALIIAERSLHLASVSNFRDVGGYRTTDGRWVRMGLAYRSNGLGALTPQDYAQLQELGLRLVCDLRLAQERSKRPDPLIPGSDTLFADVAADSGHRSTDVPMLVNLRDEAAVVNFIKGAYRDFVYLPSARAGYRQLLERLADPESFPTVFHCTAGKDRTGWAQAVLLGILGVPRKTIMEDYVLTDRFMSVSAVEQILNSLPQAGVTLSKALTSAEPAFLETAFSEVERHYGSFDGYLRQGLGLDERTLAAIRANFLTG